MKDYNSGSHIYYRKNKRWQAFLLRKNMLRIYSKIDINKVSGPTDNESLIRFFMSQKKFNNKKFRPLNLPKYLVLLDEQIE